jgi:hypothetical protein
MYHSEFCDVSYLEDLNVVFVVWKKFCTGNDYRAPLLYAVDVMKEHMGCNFVADTRDGFEDDPSDMQWIFDEFIPKTLETDCAYIFFVIDQDNRLKEELDKQTGELKNHFHVRPCFSLDEVREILKAEDVL